MVEILLEFVFSVEMGIIPKRDKTPAWNATPIKTPLDKLVPIHHLIVVKRSLCKFRHMLLPF